MFNVCYQEKSVYKMKKMDVIIFAGQSNMQGQSEKLTNTEIVERAYEYKYLAQTAVPLRNPVGENIRYDMSEGYDFTEETLSGTSNRIGLETFGIIRVGHFTNDERDIEIMEVQNEVCRENTGFLMLTEIAVELNKQPEYMNPHVAGHYSAKGLETLGTLAGQALAEYRNKQ